MSSITVKVAYKDDIRRFCLPETITFADFVNHVGKLFKVDEVTVKYVDDEGDAIVVTSDEELQEAFRLAKELKPPILRVTIQGAALALKKTEVVIVEKTILPSGAELTTTSQYPPLDVAYWDAPAKTTPQPLAATLPEEPRPTRIAQQMADHCQATSRSVTQCSRDTANDTLKYSDSTRLQLNNSGLVHSTVSLCSELSRKIAEDCRLLSLQTAEISRTLAAERSADVHNFSGYKNNLDLLAAETAQMCRNLCQATTLSSMPL